MKAAIQQAIISYCPDLTSPNARSIPIAVLTIASDERGWVAGAAGVQASRLGLDPMSSAMLSDGPHLIRKHVDGAVHTAGPDAAPDAVFRALADVLRTSIHVSHISEAESQPVTGLLHQFVMARSLATLQLSIADWRKATNIQRGDASSHWQPSVEPEELVDPSPEVASWPISRALAAETAPA